MAQEDIIIKMGMDASAFNRGLQSAKVQAKQFNGALNSFGSAMGALGLAALTAKTIEYGSQIADMSARLGVSTDALQEFAYAAQLSGGTLDDFAAAMQKLAVARADALGGNEDITSAFSALGVTMNDLKTARIEDLFKRIGGSVRDAADVQNVLNDATTIFGKNSANVLAAMRNDLAAAADEAQRLGLIIGEDVIKQLDELGDNADTLGKKLMAWFAPPLIWVVDQLHDIVDGLRIIGITAAGVGLVLKDSLFGARGSVQAGMAAAGEQIEAILAASDARAALRATGGRTRPAPLNLRETAGNAAAIANLQERKNALEREGLGIAEQRKAVELELKRLTAERVKPNIGEKRELEIDIKRLELKKQLAAIGEKEREVKTKFKELRMANVEAVGAAETARGERTKYTLQEMAEGNPWGVADPKLREEMFKAQQAARLEAQGRWWRQRGNPAMAEQRFNAADKIKEGLTFLQGGERYQFKSIDEGVQKSAKALQEFIALSKGQGHNMKAVMGK